MKQVIVSNSEIKYQCQVFGVRSEFEVGAERTVAP